MASIGHIAVGMAAARVYRRGQRTKWTLASSMVVWSFLSLLPDGDVLGFNFGIAYGDAWGHRGATHSLVFAFGLAAVLGLLAPLCGLDRTRTALVSVVVIGSHGALDTLTDGGLGCALWWPFDEHRYFAPWNPIPVAPIGRRFFSSYGLSVALTELVLFSPLFLYAVWPRRGTHAARAFAVRPLSPADVQAIASWRYTGPHAFYDEPEGREAESARYKLDPANGFHAVVGPEGLAGFCSFGQDGRVPGGTYDADALDIGAGMDPALVGQGHGRAFLSAVVTHATTELDAPVLRATIASWNERALRAARSVGFEPASTFRTEQGVEFTVLLRPRARS